MRCPVLPSLLGMLMTPIFMVVMTTWKGRNNQNEKNGNRYASILKQQSRHPSLKSRPW